MSETETNKAEDNIPGLTLATNLAGEVCNTNDESVGVTEKVCEAADLIDNTIVKPIDRAEGVEGVYDGKIDELELKHELSEKVTKDDVHENEVQHESNQNLKTDTMKSDGDDITSANTIATISNPIDQTIESISETNPDDNSTAQNEKEPDFLDRALAGEDIQFSSDEDAPKPTVPLQTDSKPGSDSDESSSDAESASNSGSESGSESESDDNTSRKRKNPDLDLSDDEDNGPLKTKNEIVDIPAPSVPSDFHLTPDMPIQYVGELSQIVERTAVIKAAMSGEFRILGDDSIFCFEDRQVLGVLFETFGRVQSPVYSVKFNTDEEAKALLSRKGQKVYYVVPASSFIFTESVRSVKGSDASNWHDEEVSEGEVEFSDDERELESKASKKKKRKKQNKPKSESQPSGQPSGSVRQRDQPKRPNPNHIQGRRDYPNQHNQGTDSRGDSRGDSRRPHPENFNQFPGMPPFQQNQQYYPPMPWLPQQYTAHQFTYGVPLPGFPFPPPPFPQQFPPQFPQPSFQNQYNPQYQSQNHGHGQGQNRSQNQNQNQNQDKLPYGDHDEYVP